MLLFLRRSNACARFELWGCAARSLTLSRVCERERSGSSQAKSRSQWGMALEARLRHIGIAGFAS